MKILNFLSQPDWYDADDTELFSECRGSAEQVADKIRDDFGREIGYGYGCGGPPYETRILLYVSKHCEFEAEPLLKLVEKFNYYFYFTHCHVMSKEELPDNTIEVSILGRPIKDHDQLLAAAKGGSYNAVMALGCNTGFPFDWYSPYHSGSEYSLPLHLAKLLLYAPVSIDSLRALARACRLGLTGDPDERMASIFEHCAEVAEGRYSEEELMEYASSFNACDDPQYIFFSEEVADRQYVFDWLQRMADDLACDLQKTASGMLEAYAENGLLEEIGIQRPKPDDLTSSLLSSLDESVF